ncbi:MAG: methylated-DNA--[protein]-cysteine S-methyltransferase [Clostridium sp.]|nr:methylated-DNA--[protein]-cysteine S-methyltransferase [Prevotella sp.]MCM1429213.1 methylated-DNA--[protein]-cysteine S-methyltransferase [Clostridium sp.]MCM1475814.1 methylated-DNA--[protein]-cysteine S-methyltransferase [Muribaculaceae bacterium]
MATPLNTVFFSVYSSPAGDLRLASCGEYLCLCDWVSSNKNLLPKICQFLNVNCEMGESDLITSAIAQLEEYFKGSRRAFNIPINLIGTDFQLRVWSELCKIPYGTTITYATQAQRIGNPKAIRAVAAANAANPISIIVPCHRVIGSNKSLTGYAGGLQSKQSLLNLESPEIFQ